jgi:hypothetical protein
MEKIELKPTIVKDQFPNFNEWKNQHEKELSHMRKNMSEYNENEIDEYERDLYLRDEDNYNLDKLIENKKETENNCDHSKICLCDYKTDDYNIKCPDCKGWISYEEIKEKRKGLKNGR